MTTPTLAADLTTVDIAQAITQHVAATTRRNPNVGAINVTACNAEARTVMHNLAATGQFASTIEISIGDTTVLVACDVQGAHNLVRWATANNVWFEETDRTGTPIARIFNPEFIARPDGTLVNWTDGAAINNQVLRPTPRQGHANNGRADRIRFEFPVSA